MQGREFTQHQDLGDLCHSLLGRSPEFSTPSLAKAFELWEHRIQGLYVESLDNLAIKLESAMPVAGRVLWELETYLETHLKIRQVSLYVHFSTEARDKADFLCRLLPWAAESLHEEGFGVFCLLLPQIKCESEGSTLSISLPKDQACILGRDHVKAMEHFYKERLGLEINVDLNLVRSQDPETGGPILDLDLFCSDRDSIIDHHVEKISREALLNGPEPPAPQAPPKPTYSGKANTSYKGRYQKSERHIWGRLDNRLDLTPLDQLDDESGLVSVYGYVAQYESRLVSNNTRALVKFSIYGDRGGIACVLFLKNPEDEGALAEKISNGTYIRADLEVSYDGRFAKDLQGKVIGIEEADPPPPRQDFAMEKRVELHLHTNMSAKDGHSKPEDLVALAEQFGMPAIAITDHGNVQAFPKAQDVLDKLKAKGSNLKLILGSEVYLVDDGRGYFAYGAGDLPMGDSFVALDLETTGLDKDSCHIIEIGAVRFTRDESGHFYPGERFSTMVNPGVPIPTKTTEITGITQAMVDEEGIEPGEALEKLHTFLGKDPIVGHNVLFDLGFLRYEAYRLVEYEEPKLKFNPLAIDTLPLARGLIEGLPSYSLDKVSQRLGVPLESHHRAVDDAIAAGFIFDKLWADQGYMPLRDLNHKLGQKDLAYVKNYKTRPYHQILLAKNQLGLYNLYRLVSLSHIRYFKSRPRIPRSVLEYYRDGLIIGSACEAGEIFQAILATYKEAQGNYDKALALINDNKDLIKRARFYDYLEIQPLGNNNFMLEKEGNFVESEQDLMNLNRLVIALAEKAGRPVVATCDAHFLNEEDAIYREILQVGSGFDAQENPTKLYLRTTDEMLEEFSYLPEDLRYEVVVTNPRKIAESIDPRVRPFPKGTYPPQIAEASEDVEKWTWDKCKDLYEKDGVILPEIEERVEKELRSIIDNGFGIMYYIAAKLVKWTNNDGYIVGSRGSVGSSVVAFLCGISEVNPLPAHYACPKCHYVEFAPEGAYGSGFDLPEKACPCCGTPLNRDGQDIPFETFLGFNGDKQPDIDLNFSGEYQDKAHQHIVEMFGEDFTYRAGTIQGYGEKNAIGLVLKYAEEKGMFLTRTESQRLAEGLVGIKRTTGQHPGGIVVIPKDREIYDFTPIQNPADKEDVAMHTTHFDFSSMHDTILKLDILGHDDPTMLKVLSDMTGVKIEDIPIPDKKVMELFQSTAPLGIEPGTSPADSATLGLPELGTLLVRDMIKETKPTQFFDLVQLSGLSHGTDVWSGNAQDLIRQGTCTINEVIGCRDGIMTNLINWGLPSKDAFNIMEKVRKGKGLTEEHENLMVEKGVPAWYIESCKKIKYMFPKAHAAAYVISSLRVAYFKVYYPAAYYAAYFSVRADEFDYQVMCRPLAQISAQREEMFKNFHQLNTREQKIYYILELVEEMYLRGLDFAPLDIERAGASRFLVLDDKTLMPALNTLPSISTAMASAIVEAREKDGPFLNHEDLGRRAGLGPSAIASMVELGLLDHIPESAQISLFDML